MQKLILTLLVALTLFDTSMAQIVYGKNRFTTMSEGVEREYIVHVPLTYSGNSEVPLVFMLHGTSGDGDKMYDDSGWAELSEKEGFIAVFPSSLRYKIIDNDGPKTTTKWNILPDADFTFQEGQIERDDIKFLRKVIDELNSKYKLENKRIYLSGFSNGGSMAARCAIEMSDVLAAVCSSAAAFYKDTIYTPKRNLPFLFQVGNKDYGPGNVGPEFPEAPMRYFDTLITTPNFPYLNGKHYRIANNVVRNFDLETVHTGIVGDTNFAVQTTYLPINPADNHEFKFVFVKSLGHYYPNWAPASHWEWMKKYSLDSPVSSSFNLTVNGGYGSGKYMAGDTVHIWAEKPIATKIFGTWAGEISTLEEKTNWHTTLIMPSKDIVFEAQFLNLPNNLAIEESNLDGPFSKKEIFSYFPPKNKMKGVLWFFSGAGGRGKYWVIRTEEIELLKLAATHDYAIITLDAEEVTQDKDLNNDGGKAYQYGADTINNPDLVNVKYFYNLMISQGIIAPGTPQMAVGFSSGGAFAEVVAAVFDWSCSLSHNTGVITILAENSPTPHYQNNSQNDDGPNVGIAGNAQATINMAKYADRNVISQWILQKVQPLHAERFANISGVTVAQSKAIFNYIKNNNLLDADNRLKMDPELIQDDYKNNPSNYPPLVTLPQDLVSEIFIQLKAVYTNHLFRSDYNGSAMKFINQFGKIVSSTNEDQNITNQIDIHPNPTSTSIHFKEIMDYKMFDTNGVEVKEGIGHEVDVTDLRAGMYYVKSGNMVGKVVVIR